MTTKIDKEACLGKVRGMYPLPGVLAEVYRLVKSDDGTLDDLAAVIRKDPSLLAEIVKLSNCPYFGFPEKCGTLTEALQRLGMREVGRLVGVCVAMEVYQSELRHYRIPPEVFWESGIAAALLMERLAVLKGLDKESAYLSGLMRESGMLVINKGLDDIGESATWERYMTLPEWERQVAGCDHAEVGGELLRNWGFSEDICQAVSRQWEVGPNDDDMARLLRLVNRTLACCGCDFSIPMESCDRCQSHLDGLGLDGADLLKAVADSAAAFKSLRGSL